MIQFIAQPIFEDKHSFETSFIDPITRGEASIRRCTSHMCEPITQSHIFTNQRLQFRPRNPHSGVLHPAGQAADATPREKREMMEALSILHDFTAPFIHRKVRRHSAAQLQRLLSRCRASAKCVLQGSMH